MTVTVGVYSDVHCPWATTVVHRLRRARHDHDLDVVFDQRAWPLEWVNKQGTPRDIVQAETAVLANAEPELFSWFGDGTWPSTFLPAFELVAAARRALGLRAAEDVDYALRRRFFRNGVDVSLRHELRAAVEATAYDPDQVMGVWEAEPVRADVAADYERSRHLPIQGSPQIFWPDGSTSHNPGMTDHTWVRGIPRLGDVDAGEPERLLLAHAADSPDTAASG